MGYLETHIPNKPFIRKVIDKIKNRRLYGIYTNAAAKIGAGRELVFMADGRMRHGGLSDRLCGIVSAYNYAKQNNLRFKIYFVCPYRLQDILLPASFNWIVNEDELSHNIDEAVPVYISNQLKYKDVEKYFHDKLRKQHEKQIHLYTNAIFFKEGEFSDLFAELFKPVPMLQAMIDENMTRIPKGYVSLTFRFQQLLGDFKEDGFPTIKTEERKELLINKCLKCVKYLKMVTNKAVLITSDSKTFLERVKVIDEVYTIPGAIRHMEYTQGKADIAVDMKSYVDFYMLANADTIYLCNISPLYHSRFPETAARVYNKPYVEITEKEMMSFLASSY